MECKRKDHQNLGIEDQESPQQKNRKPVWDFILSWGLWAACLVAAIAPILVQRKFDYSNIIELHRYPWGLLPFPLLMIRWFADVAPTLVLILLIIGFISIRNPLLKTKLVNLGAILTVVFTSLYAATMMMVLSGYLEYETERDEEFSEFEKIGAPQKSEIFSESK